MTQCFGWCFIGSGKLANKVAKQIIKSGRHRIVSVYSRNKKSGGKFAEKFGAEFFTGAEAAITADNVDGVYVVTPHNSHFIYAKMAIEHNKPVLCEKAFTVNAAQAEELINLARSKKVYLAEAMWTWFAPVANKVKFWLDNGEFGTVESVKSSFCLSLGRVQRIADPNRAGGALLDLGIYPITYLYRLFGKPTSIRCNGEISGGVDWKEKLYFEYPQCKNCSVITSVKSYMPERLIIDGTKAKIKLTAFHCANRVKLIRKDGNNEKFIKNGGYLNEFDIVASEISEGLTESRYIPLQDTLEVMRIADECRRQMNLVYPFEKP